MAILGQLPPNLVFLIGILEPVQWTVTAERPWRRPDDASPARSASKAPATPEDPSDASDNPE